MKYMLPAVVHVWKIETNKTEKSYNKKWEIIAITWKQVAYFDIL